MSLIGCGSIHQGHERFSDDSRGRQEIFMCLAALLYEQFLRILEWKCQDIDLVLLQFDEYDGPSIFENRPKCVPICPVTITLQISATCHGTPTIPHKT